MMTRAPRDRSKPNSIDEATDAYRHHRLADQERPQSQRPRRNPWHFLWRMAHCDGADGASSRPQSRQRTSLAPPTCFWVTTSITTEPSVSATASNMCRAWRPARPNSNSTSTNTTPTTGISRKALSSELDNKYFHGEKPTWNNFVNHPNYDSFWKDQVVNLILKKTTVPNLNVAGWWDQEDYYGPMKIYETLGKTGRRGSQKLRRHRPVASRRMGRRRLEARPHRIRRRPILVLSRKNRSPLVRLLAKG